jgi:hypothetical protein
MMLSLILGGAFGFLLLVFGFAGSSSAATGDTLVSTATTVSADTVAGSSGATVSGDGATVSADSPVGSADVTVSGDGGTVSADSPVGSADVTVGEAPNTSPGLDVSVDPAISPNEGIAVDRGAQAEAPALLIDFGRSRFTVPWDQSAGSLGQLIRGISTGDVPDPLRVPSYPANPIAPEGRTGMSPTPSSNEDHLPGGTWSWLTLIVLFSLLWYLLTARSQMPHGVGAVLALPG